MLIAIPITKTPQSTLTKEFKDSQWTKVNLVSKVKQKNQVYQVKHWFIEPGEPGKKVNQVPRITLSSSFSPFSFPSKIHSQRCTLLLAVSITKVMITLLHVFAGPTKLKFASFIGSSFQFIHAQWSFILWFLNQYLVQNFQMSTIPFPEMVS